MYCTPFLLFDGNCAEAMTFYQNCFGGDLTLTRTRDTPMKDQFGPEKQDKIINARLKSGMIEFSATDWHADSIAPQHGNTFSIYLTGATYNDLKGVFDALCEGADRDERTFMTLREMPFGTYGQLTDKYRVSWVFVGQNQ